MSKKWTQYSIITVVIFLLLLPYIQTKTNLISIEPLKGAIEKASPTYFSFAGWFSGAYQEGKEKFINDNYGLRDFFIKLNNQISFDLFNKAKANGVIIGKNNVLYEENYLRAYSGLDFIGKDSIQKQINRLKVIQDYLLTQNKTLLLILASGKGSFFPEYFPDSWTSDKGTTNYETYLNFAQQKGINLIDFNSWFLKNKHTSEYPLYPKYGIHWSYYGMCLVVDSLVNHIERIRQIRMPDITWDSVAVLESQKTDYDIAEGMNLLFPPAKEKLGYPNIKIVERPEDVKPSAIVIADSYYWGMFNESIPARVFSDQHFWFYNRQIFPDSYKQPVEVSQLNLKDELANHDVFIIMCTEANLSKLGWGFIEEAHKVINSSEESNLEFDQKVSDLINYIKTDEAWMKSIAEKAKNNNISVDSMLLLDARWQVRQNESK